ncbi:MAG: hypothetical protein Q9227_008355 [Pyrenula ochraceoflavens]
MARIKWDLDSETMLLRRFHQDTSGILSVRNGRFRDGRFENMWCNLIQDLVRDFEVVKNAILTLTAFHSSHERPEMKYTAIKYKGNCLGDLNKRIIEYTVFGIEFIPVEAILAATLTLGFADGWDQHTVTGILFLVSAKCLLEKAVEMHHIRPFSPDKLARIRPLCRVFVYMDVLSRLTERQQREVPKYDYLMDSFNSFAVSAPGHFYEVDSLMGCATSLFPLIGRTADLIQNVRNAPEEQRNSMAVMRQAMVLSEQLTNWRAPELDDINPPQEKSCEVKDFLNTAEAYRYATLLYLRQAVPLIQSKSSTSLAEDILKFLREVPISSSAILVQIFPLVVAGCEAEHSTWVKDRWSHMSRRMRIGNVDKCAEVVKMCWKNRGNARKTRQAIHSQGMGDSLLEMQEPTSIPGGLNMPGQIIIQHCSLGHNDIDSVSEEISYLGTDGQRLLKDEYPVGGTLHWTGIMQKEGWESESSYV